MLEDLKKLSDRATSGPWSVESMDNEGNSPSDKFTSYCIEANGKALADTLNSLAICLEEERDEDWSRTWDEQGRRDTAFIVALVNAYRRGELHDDTALATAVARARREALEEAAEAADAEEMVRSVGGQSRLAGDAIRARVATPPEARHTETGWPDISTAPRDGTWFLGIDDSASIRNVRWTRWWAPSGRTQEWLCHEAPGSWSPTRWNAGPTPPPPAIGNLEGEGRS